MFSNEFVEEILERVGGNSANFVLDGSGNCIFANKNAILLLGTVETQIIGLKLLDQITIYPLDGDELVSSSNPIIKALTTKDYIQTAPFFCKLSLDEKQITYAIQVYRITSESGSVLVFVQIRKALREVEVGEMKSLFLSFAANQLKTPSSIIKGFLELLIREGEASYSADQWKYLTSAFEANEQMLEVSKSLLRTARLDGGIIEPHLTMFDPIRALQSKIAILSPLYKIKRLSVNLTPSNEEGVTTILSDESFLLEIFGIILGNAIKHSPIDGAINISVLVNKQQCAVHVIDQGSGLPEKVLQEVNTGNDTIDADQTTQFGLGLYMAKKYIALLGGSFGAQIGEDVGSDVYFSIPNQS